MDYEKKYKEALERARALKNGKDVDIESGTTTCEYIFPELMESEDEKIRKSLLSYLHGLGELEYLDKNTYNKWIAWLEKQGEKTNPYSGVSFEYNGHTWGMCARDYGVDISLDKQLFTHLEEQGVQKSTNTKTKFHEGDWVVHNGVGAYKIIEVCESWYEVISYNNEIGIQYSIGFDKENDCRLWTIEDAKDGDVLAFYYKHKGNKMEQVGIIKKYVGRHGGCSNSFNIYVGLNWENNLQIGEYMGSSDIQPATKEQRGRLEKEITKAGYGWNKEKLKLEKI